MVQPTISWRGLSNDSKTTNDVMSLRVFMLHGLLMDIGGHACDFNGHVASSKSVDPDSHEMSMSQHSSP